MKAKLYLLLSILFASGSLLAQAPEKMSFQAVIRDIDGKLIAESPVTITVSILQADATGLPVFTEIHSVTTNANGLATLEIGQGEAIEGSLGSIDWTNGPYFLKTETEIGGGIATIIGISQFMSVPYSLFSNNTGEIQGKPVSPNNPAIGYILKWNGTAWEPAPDETGISNTYDAGSGISISGNTISNTAPDQPVTISGEGITTVSGSYPNFTISTPTSDDNSITNEIQSLSLSGSILSLSNGGGSVTLPPEVDGSITNEIQTLSLSGTNLSLSNGGGTITLPTGTTYTAGTGISISGSTVTNTGDTDAANDITNTTIAGGDLSGTYPNPTVVKIQGNIISPAIPVTGDVLKWNGTQWQPGTDATSGGGSYSAGAGISISGNAISNTAPDQPVSILGNGITTVSGSYPNFTISTPASADNSITNEIQSLSLSGSILSLSNGGSSVTLPPEIDGSITNEIQTLSLSGTSLSLSSGGGIVTLPTGTTYTAGTGISITGNAITNTGDADNNPVNEIQTLSLSGTSLSLSNGGGNVTLPTGTTYTAGTGISISGNTITNTGDTDATNDITNTTIAGGDLSGTYPNPSVIKIQSRNVANTVPIDQQVLKWSTANNRWEPSNDTGDNWGSQVVQTGFTLSGSGTLGSPLGIAQQGATNGQVLKWNGTNWMPAADNNTTYSAGIGISITGNAINNTGDTDAANDITNTTIAGGDLSGIYPNPAVIRLQGRPINSVAPTTNQVLQWNGSNWTPATLANSSGWLLNGNSETTAANFLGTTDVKPLLLRVNNIAAGVIHPTNNNTAIGLEALANNTTGTNNTAYGNGALKSSTSGVNNTAVGSYALFNSASVENPQNYIGSSNTAIGTQGLYNNLSGFKNSSVGSYALFSNTVGTDNIAIGESALYSNIDGWRNAALGNSALYSNTSGYENVAIGIDALLFNTTKNNLVAVGDGALRSNGIGATLSSQSIDNTAVGSKALYENTSGSSNTSIGFEALRNNTTGNWNSAFGSSALNVNTTGSDNVSFGDGSLSSNNTGSNNVAIGSLTLTTNTIGNYNTAIGWGANVNSNNRTNTTAIGYNTVVNANNKVRIGNTAVAIVEGPVVYTTSDARFKKNVTEEVKGLSFITHLRPVVYNYKAKEHQQFLLRQLPDTSQRRSVESIDFSEAESVRQSGFIAQEVEEAAKAAGYDFNGIHVPENENDYYTLSYQQFVVPLVKAVQEQQEMIDAQNKAIELLQQKVSEMAVLQAELQEMKSLLLQKHK